MLSLRLVFVSIRVRNPPKLREFLGLCLRVGIRLTFTVTENQRIKDFLTRSKKIIFSRYSLVVRELKVRRILSSDFEKSYKFELRLCFNCFGSLNYRALCLKKLIDNLRWQIARCV